MQAGLNLHANALPQIGRQGIIHTAVEVLSHHREQTAHQHDQPKCQRQDVGT